MSLLNGKNPARMRRRTRQLTCRLTHCRRFDKRWCANRRICVPWRKRSHRPMPHSHCMKFWKLSLSLCMENSCRIIRLRPNQAHGSRQFGRPFMRCRRNARRFVFRAAAFAAQRLDSAFYKAWHAADCSADFIISRRSLVAATSAVG
jgi:hypothetical protein